LDLALKPYYQFISQKGSIASATRVSFIRGPTFLVVMDQKF
jgi:hypothetical protein